MMHKILILVAAIAFTGCTTPQTIQVTPAAQTALPTAAAAVSATTAVTPPVYPRCFDTDPKQWSIYPKASCTPGALNPDVTQANIHDTICRSGYTRTIRPPESYTEPLKKQQMVDYGWPATEISNLEEDHFVPLEIGGNPTDPKNLWPEPHDDHASYGLGSNTKDLTENAANKAVCSGQMQLADAQQKIIHDWVALCKELRAATKCG